MAQTQDDSLERRIGDLESAVRSLLAAAAVGGTSVAAKTTAGVTLTGGAGVGSVGWDTASGPTVDLFVSTSRLRIDMGASFEVYGNKCSLFVGYQIRGPVADPAVTPLATAPVITPPAYESSASLQDDGVGMNQLGAFSNFDVITGLPVGWYRVQAAYAITYSGTSGNPYGIATYRRIAATRY